MSRHKTISILTNDCQPKAKWLRKSFITYILMQLIIHVAKLLQPKISEFLTLCKKQMGKQFIQGKVISFFQILLIQENTLNRYLTLSKRAISINVL